MLDEDLNKLNKIKPPQIDEAAKKHALHLAMKAYDKKNIKISQGFLLGERLIDTTKQKLWSFIMKKQLIIGTAITGVIVCFVSVPILRDTIPFISRNDEKTGLTALTESAEIQHRGVEASVMSNSVSPLIPDRLVERTDADYASYSKKAQERSLSTVNAMPFSAMPYPNEPYAYAPPQNQDKFTDTVINPIKKVADEPVSTVSIDVDTASYSYVRKSLNNGVAINEDAVRVEELINYFDYAYPLPQDSSIPFKPTISVFPTPWNKDTKLMHIGIKGYDITEETKPKANLVLLLDVSGSMNEPDKLPLLINSLRLLVDNMGADDVVSIVTYAGNAGTALEPTKASEKQKIFAALDNLHAGGSTAGEQGILQAYALAEKNFDSKGVNRIILATDGDFNVGISDPESLKRLVEKKRKNGVFLSILGFGQGNYNDELMQVLAQNGNGNAAYIDNLNEARKVLVEESSSTLFPIAKDVKIQIEFNPTLVSEYRLIGYETRMLQREDFNNDKVDAGDIGSGHTVTAIYEITPVGSKAQMIDDLRYQQQESTKKPDTITGNTSEYAFLKMRYKLPKEDTSKLIEIPVNKSLEFDSINMVSPEARFATSVAAFGQKLRKETAVDSYSYEEIISLAESSKGEDKFGYRAEFLNLVRLAKAIK